MQIADAVAVIDIAPAGHTTTSVGATECECTGGKRGSGESKGDCKSNYGLTQHELPFHRIVLNTYDRALRNRFIDIAAIWARLRQFFCSLEPAKLSRPEGHVCPTAAGSVAHCRVLCGGGEAISRASEIRPRPRGGTLFTVLCARNS
jgi:hypothetical protein